jgi:hypothetical protein
MERARKTNEPNQSLTMYCCEVNIGRFCKSKPYLHSACNAQARGMKCACASDGSQVQHRLHAHAPGRAMPFVPTALPNPAIKVRVRIRWLASAASPACTRAWERDAARPHCLAQPRHQGARAHPMARKCSIACMHTRLGVRCRSSPLPCPTPPSRCACASDGSQVQHRLHAHAPGRAMPLVPTAMPNPAIKVRVRIRWLASAASPACTRAWERDAARPHCHAQPRL